MALPEHPAGHSRGRAPRRAGRMHPRGDEHPAGARLHADRRHAGGHRASTRCCCRWWRSRRSARRATWSWRPTRRPPRSSPADCRRMAPVASPRYVELAGVVALLTAGCLLLARLFRLGFLADFLSQTVLVGLPHRRRLPGRHRRAGRDARPAGRTRTRTVEQLAQVVRERCRRCTCRRSGSPRRWWRWCSPAARFAPRLPGPLVAVVGAIAASAAFDFAGHGIARHRPGAGRPAAPRGCPTSGWARRRGPCSRSRARAS